MNNIDLEETKKWARKNRGPSEESLRNKWNSDFGALKEEIRRKQENAKET